jgi:hypothetical protein
MSHIPNEKAANTTARADRFRRARPELGAALLLAVANGVLFAGALYKRERWQAVVQEHDCEGLE